MKSEKIIRNILVGTTAAGVIGGLSYINKKQVDVISRKYVRTKEYFDVTYQWVVNKQNKRTLDAFFRNEEIKSIAIYGMGSLGELFYSELKGRGIVEVNCFVDQMADLYSYGLDDIPIRDSASMMQDEIIDAVIVTPVHIFNEIKNDLLKRGYNGKILSLRDVIEQMA